MCSILPGIDWLIYSQLGHLFTIKHCRRAVATPTGLNAKTAFFFNESCRTKVPKPYSKESMSSGTFSDVSQSDWTRTRSVKTTDKRHRGAVRDRVHKENYGIDTYISNFL